jgi:hypothetical protein
VNTYKQPIRSPLAGRAEDITTADRLENLSHTLPGSHDYTEHFQASIAYSLVGITQSRHLILFVLLRCLAQNMLHGVAEGVSLATAMPLHVMAAEAASSHRLGSFGCCGRQRSTPTQVLSMIQARDTEILQGLQTSSNDEIRCHYNLSIFWQNVALTLAQLDI